MFKLYPAEISGDLTMTDIAGRHCADEIYLSQRADACIVLRWRQGTGRMQYSGNVVPDQIEEIYAQFTAAGHDTFGPALLLDFAKFNGTIDWGYANKRKMVGARMKPPPRKIAYVMRDEHAVLMGRALSAWLHRQESRVFVDADMAEAWLGWR